MDRLRKITLITTGIIIGGLFGIWYNGAYLDHRIMVNGQDIIELSESEVMDAMMESSDNLDQETFVTFFGIGGFWVNGSWPMWFYLISFTTLFGYVGYHLHKYLINKKGQSTSEPELENN